MDLPKPGVALSGAGRMEDAKEAYVQMLRSLPGPDGVEAQAGDGFLADVSRPYGGISRS